MSLFTEQPVETDGHEREKNLPRIRLRGTRDRDWQRIYLHFQKGKCWLCKRTKPKLDCWHHLDHDGRNWDPANIRRAHRSCNTTESNSYRASMGKREREEKHKLQPEPLTRGMSWEASRSLELRPTLELECRRLLAESAANFTTARSTEEAWLPTVKNMQDRLSKILGCDQEVVAKMIDRELQPEGFLSLSERTVVDCRKKRTAQILSVKKGHETDQAI